MISFRLEEEEKVRQKLQLERGNADKRIKTLDEALAVQEDSNTKITKERKILEDRLNNIMSNLGSEEEKVKSLSKQKNKYESIIADLKERLKIEQQVCIVFTELKQMCILFYLSQNN